MTLRSWVLVVVGATVGVLATIIVHNLPRSYEVFKFGKKRSLWTLNEVIKWPPKESALEGENLNFPVWDLSDDWADFEIRKGEYYFLIPGDSTQIDIASHPIVWTEDIYKDRIIGYDYITPNKSVKSLKSGEFWRLLLDVLATSRSRIRMVEFDGQRWIIPKNKRIGAVESTRCEQDRSSKNEFLI